MPATDPIYPQATRELAERRSHLAPDTAKAFRAFSQSVFAEGAHISAALQQGATAAEIMEAIWVAAEMRAGAAYAHSALALDTIASAEGQT